MNKYIFIINSKGERISSMVETKNRKGEVLLAYAKEQYPDAAEYVSGDDAILDAFISGKVYKDGELVDAPLVEPTEAEVKKASIATIIATIKQKYEEKFKSYESALMRARLAGNDATIAKLQELYKSDMAAMVKDMKEV